MSERKFHNNVNVKYFLIFENSVDISGVELCFCRHDWTQRHAFARCLEKGLRSGIPRRCGPWSSFFLSKPWFLQTQNVEAVKKSDWHWSTVSSSVRVWHHWFSLVVKMRGSNEVYLHQLGDIRSMSGPRRHQLTSATWDAILAQLWPAGSFQIVLHMTCDGVKEAERFWDECCR